jgi:hypothetical protein
MIIGGAYMWFSRRRGSLALRLRFRQAAAPTCDRSERSARPSVELVFRDIMRYRTRFLITFDHGITLLYQTTTKKSAMYKCTGLINQLSQRILNFEAT